jgi:hypothetical protein
MPLHNLIEAGVFLARKQMTDRGLILDERTGKKQIWVAGGLDRWPVVGRMVRKNRDRFLRRQGSGIQEDRLG